MVLCKLTQGEFPVAVAAPIPRSTAEGTPFFRGKIDERGLGFAGTATLHLLTSFLWIGGTPCNQSCGNLGFPLRIMLATVETSPEEVGFFIPLAIGFVIGALFIRIIGIPLGFLGAQPIAIPVAIAPPHGEPRLVFAMAIIAIALDDFVMMLSAVLLVVRLNAAWILGAPCA